ncbi:InlB B-repeat-containing protein [Cytobacillus praedii]|uniref:Uncharacterized protein n=1 Tax=Cytobacillus praedii TaxID=1742358 RepID=A0A4R1AVJ5_9BACI|nr:InlB B-repeat-containing protein [Cytobacillus praedii]TCJ03807.1 hypothetical protein E0Y62_12700 [Cytobacillus praedii]
MKNKTVFTVITCLLLFFMVRWDNVLPINGVSAAENKDVSNLQNIVNWNDRFVTHDYFDIKNLINGRQVSGSRTNYIAYENARIAEDAITVFIGQEISLTANNLKYQDYPVIFFESVPGPGAQLGLGSASNLIQTGFTFQKSMVDNGQIKFKASEEGVYTFQVRWQSGQGLQGARIQPYTDIFTITIKVENPPPTDIRIFQRNAPGGFPGMRIGYLTGLDNYGDSNTFSIVNDPKDLFEVSTIDANAKRGFLRLKEGKALAAGESAMVRLKVTDSVNNSFEKDINIVGVTPTMVNVANGGTNESTYSGVDLSAGLSIILPEKGALKGVFEGEEYEVSEYGMFNGDLLKYVANNETGIDSFILGEQYYIVVIGNQGHSVSFEVDGGSPVANQSVENEGKVVKPEDPMKQGYTFAGWYTDKTYSTPFNFSTQITDNTKIYAKWNANQYTISFNSNGGSAVGSIKSDYGTKITAPAVPTKSGYSFVGWYKDAAFNHEWAFETEKVISDQTLFAKWEINKYTVSFNSNGGNAVANQSVEHDGTATKPEDPTKQGYTFAGWYTDNTYSTPYNFGTTVTTNKTIYAKWAINQYTISFDSNGGSEVETITADYGAKVAFPTVPTKVGYTFAGWYKDEAFNHTWAFEADQVTGNQMLYAKWEINKYLVSFHSDGGSSVASQTVAHDGKAKEPDMPTKQGHTFAGWYTDNTYSTQYDFGTLINADKTIYAKWTVNQYTISFDSNGGSALQSVKADFKTKISAPSAPTKVGYTFVGWYKDALFNHEWAFDEDEVTDDQMLYAKWKIKKYKVSFDSNGGSSVIYQSVDHDGTATVPQPPTKQGYTFTGWYTDNTYSTPYDFGTSITGDKTIYAKWIINQYIISFQSNGGSNVDPLTEDYETKISAPLEPVKAGYIFVGWYKDEQYKNEWIFEADQVTDDQTLYAKWEIKKYKVSFDSTGGDSIQNQSVSHGGVAIEPQFPTRPGYTFAGWYTDSIYNTLYNFDTPIVDDKTLYAKWKINQYTVSFDSTGGSKVESLTADYETKIIAPKAPTRVGYIFAGWYKDPQYTDLWNLLKDKVVGEITLYAKWNPYIPSSDSEGETSSPSNTEEIVVDVNGENGTNLTKTPIKRTTEPNGTVRDLVAMSESIAKDTVEKAKQQGVDTARIVIPDTNDKVSEVTVEIPKSALKQLNDGKLKLEIATDNAIIAIPTESIASFNDNLYFRVVPLKSKEEQKQVEERAKKEELIQEITHNQTVQVLGRPMEIETNMQSREVSIVLPLKDSLPANAKEREKILDNLGIYIEHSDGTKEVLQGKVVSYKNNGELGLEFKVNKFSTFTIVYMEGAQAFFDGKATCGKDALTADAIGCVSAKKSVPVYELVNNRLKKADTLSAGHSVPAYEAISPMLGLGGDIWVERTDAIRYETPSKVMLAKNAITGSKREKQIWKGLELRPGQIGKVTVLQDTVIWEKINKTKKLPRILKKGEQYRVYRYVPGMYDLGNGKYMVQDDYVIFNSLN